MARMISSNFIIFDSFIFAMVLIIEILHPLFQIEGLLVILVWLIWVSGFLPESNSIIFKINKIDNHFAHKINKN